MGAKDDDMHAILGGIIIVRNGKHTLTISAFGVSWKLKLCAQSQPVDHSRHDADYRGDKCGPNCVVQKLECFCGSSKDKYYSSLCIQPNC